jgi:hypothetical protein
MTERARNLARSNADMPPAGHGGLRRWSTAGLGEDSWKALEGILADLYAAGSAERPPEAPVTVSCTGTGRPLGPLFVSSVETTPVRIQRAPWQVRLRPCEYLFLVQSLRGGGVTRQADRSAHAAGSGH